MCHLHYLFSSLFNFKRAKNKGGNYRCVCDLKIFSFGVLPVAKSTQNQFQPYHRENIVEKVLNCPIFPIDWLQSDGVI